MTLGMASKGQSPNTQTLEQIRARAEAADILGTTRYWTPEIHVGSFNLPPYIAEHLPTSAK